MVLKKAMPLLFRVRGFQFWPYFYLGAKHMVTGFDHLAFLAGVIFFYKLKEVGLYVTLFAIGHSLTLIAGVWFDIPANVYLIDAIIGFSVVYKAFENLGGLKSLGFSINPKHAVFAFGFFTDSASLLNFSNSLFPKKDSSKTSSHLTLA